MSRVGPSFHWLYVSLLAALVVALGISAAAQDAKSDTSTDQAAPAAPQTQGSQAADPLKRPLTEQQRRQNEKSFKKEVSGTYKKWLDEDVRWIITDEERSAFKQLSNDEERDQFIEAF